MPDIEVSHLIILFMATWRMASLMAQNDDNGPEEVFLRLRVEAGMKFDERSQPYGDTMFARGLMCLWCNSFWFGLGFTLLYILSPWTIFVALPLALSTAAITLEKING